MTVTPARSYTRIAIAIVIAAVVVSASVLSYSSFEATVTKTTTAVLTSTIITTSTVTCGETGLGALTTNCQLGITLGLTASPEVSLGQNQSAHISLSNNFAVPQNVNFTGLPALPHGPVLFSTAASVDVLPLPPICGYPSAQMSPDHVPAYIVVYNSSGVPVQLTDSAIETLNCLHETGDSHSFNASQTITETLGIGGYWTSKDPSQPWVNATYNMFSPGNYTIAAFDPWQQLSELNFTVARAATIGAPIPISSIETANISIAKSPYLIAVDSNTDRIYVSDSFSTDLTVVDAATHQVVAVVTMPGNDTYGLALDPKTNMIYVPVVECTEAEISAKSCNVPGTNSNGEGVVEISGITDKITGELPFGVRGLAINPTTDMLYGTGTGPDLLAIDAGTGSLMASIPLNASGADVTVDQDTNMVYVAACGAPSPSLVCGSEVFFVNGTDQRLQTTVQLRFGTYPSMTEDPDTNTVYITGDAALVALDGTTGQTIYQVSTSTCIPIQGLSVNPVTDEVYAVPQSLNYLLVFDAATGHLVNMYSTTEQPQYPSFNPNTGELYLTLPTSLAIFPDVISTGHVDTSLLDGGENCLPP